MKVKKTIEVEVCDTCGAETNTALQCRLCLCKVCQFCSDIIHVQIDRYTASRQSQIGHGHTFQNGRYCLDCGTKVIKTLRELRLVESVPTRDSIATVDASS
jgi:hypothetical protein